MNQEEEQEREEIAEFFLQSLEICRENYSYTKSSDMTFSSKYFVLKKTFLNELFHFDQRSDKLYEDQHILYNHGKVVWGHLIQANEKLYTAGSSDHPGAMLYSCDPRVDNNPSFLETVAVSLYNIKGKETDPKLAIFSEKLADEMVHDWKLPIPLSITNGIQCYYITNMIFRKHIPHGILNGGLFPFLICPERTDIGMILPECFWPDEFTTLLWRGNDNDVKSVKIRGGLPLLATFIFFYFFQYLNLDQYLEVEAMAFVAITTLTIMAVSFIVLQITLFRYMRQQFKQ